MELTAEQRQMRSRKGAYVRWSHTPDRTAATAPARNARMERWADRVDPLHMLADDVRKALAQDALKAHMIGLAFKSSLARSKPPHAIPTTCSWCHPKARSKSHQTCECHAHTLDQMVAEVRARHSTRAHVA